MNKGKFYGEKSYHREQKEMHYKNYVFYGQAPKDKHFAAYIKTEEWAYDRDAFIRTGIFYPYSKRENYKILMARGQNDPIDFEEDVDITKLLERIKKEFVSSYPPKTIYNILREWGLLPLYRTVVLVSSEQNWEEDRKSFNIAVTNDELKELNNRFETVEKLSWALTVNNLQYALEYQSGKPRYITTPYTDSLGNDRVMKKLIEPDVSTAEAFQMFIERWRKTPQVNIYNNSNVQNVENKNIVTKDLNSIFETVKQIKNMEEENDVVSVEEIEKFNECNNPIKEIRGRIAEQNNKTESNEETNGDSAGTTRCNGGTKETE